MIKITPLGDQAASPTLLVEGRLDAPVIDALRAATLPHLEAGSRLGIDVAGVSYADAGGVSLLRELVARGAELLQVTEFLRALLDAEPVRRATTWDEAALVRGLRARDERAAEALIRIYGGRLLGVARRVVRSDEEARDVVQEAYLSAFGAIDGFTGSAKLSTWLHRIVVNVALMRLRRRRRHPEESLDDVLPRFDESGRWATAPGPWTATAETLLERQQNRTLVRAAIDRLPQGYRTVLMLRDIEELDTEETAQALGISANAVKIRLHRARQALRALIEPALGAEQLAGAPAAA